MTALTPVTQNDLVQMLRQTALLLEEWNADKILQDRCDGCGATVLGALVDDEHEPGCISLATEAAVRVIRTALGPEPTPASHSCAMVVDWKIDEVGDPADEIECGNPAVADCGGGPICAPCIARVVGRDPDLATDMRPLPGGLGIEEARLRRTIAFAISLLDDPDLKVSRVLTSALHGYLDLGDPRDGLELASRILTTDERPYPAGTVLRLAEAVVRFGRSVPRGSVNLVPDCRCGGHSRLHRGCYIETRGPRG